MSFCIICVDTWIFVYFSLQVREQESAVARHQAVVVNRKLHDIKREKAQAKAAAVMAEAERLNNQRNAALVQLGTAHVYAADATDQRRAVIRHHKERQTHLIINAEQRGIDAIKV